MAGVTGFDMFEELIRDLGGIASRRELLTLGEVRGWTDTDFWFAQYYGHLDRIRPGWYASRDLPADARAAWREGGPLACVSALVHYGISEPLDLPDHRVGTRLHISIPHNGRRPRGASRDTVVHWNTADHRSGTRQAVHPDAALRQARTCVAALLEYRGWSRTP